VSSICVSPRLLSPSPVPGSPCLPVSGLPVSPAGVIRSSSCAYAAIRALSIRLPLPMSLPRGPRHRDRCLSRKLLTGSNRKPHKPSLRAKARTGADVPVLFYNVQRKGSEPCAFGSIFNSSMHSSRMTDRSSSVIRIVARTRGETQRRGCGVSKRPPLRRAEGLLVTEWD
jgi:hypothetical protein